MLSRTIRARALLGALSDRIGREPIRVGITVLPCLSFYFGACNGAMVAALAEMMPANARVASWAKKA